MTRLREISHDELDLSRYVRPGDTVVWGQACAEPQALTAALMRQRRDIGPFTCFLGLPATDTCHADHGDSVRFVSYCASGPNRALVDAGCLEILPVHYSALPDVLSAGELRVDVTLLLVPPPDPDGWFRIGVADEYLSAALDAARTVIVEVSENVPRLGCRRLPPDRIDVVVRSQTHPVEMPRRDPTAIDGRIGELVADLVPDGATLQVGLGAVPAAVLAELTHHRDLGIHSGLLADPVVDLVESGAITGARKSVDPGMIVGGVLMGSSRLLDFVHGNPAVSLRDTRYTHAPDVLAVQAQFTAINSALEVDLTGQVNTESVGGRYVGAMGGAADFARGARYSPGGLAITALPSTIGQHSRIVASLSGPASMARSDAGVVVTEHGVADLRNCSLDQRRERMLAIADPGHRDDLARACKQRLGEPT